MILCIGTTPALQRVMVFRRFEPGMVNRAVEIMDGLGGKALNVARVLAHLGVPSLAMGFAGGERGRWMIAELEQANIAHEFIAIEHETRLCTTVIDQSTRSVTELVEESGAADPENYTKLLDVLEKRLAGAQALVMSGTLTPGAPTDFYARCTALAKKQGVLTVIDAHSAPLEEALAEQPDVAKPNRAELQRTLGHPLASDDDVWHAMQSIQRKGAGSVVVTDGPHAVFAAARNRRWKITPPVIEALNPIGSGDAFTAALAAELLRGASLHQACVAGAAAGAANALTWMPGTLDPVRYKDLLSHTQMREL